MKIKIGIILGVMLVCMLPVVYGQDVVEFDEFNSKYVEDNLIVTFDRADKTYGFGDEVTVNINFKDLTDRVEIWTIWGTSENSGNIIREDPVVQNMNVTFPISYIYIEKGTPLIYFWTLSGPNAYLDRQQTDSIILNSDFTDMVQDVVRMDDMVYDMNMTMMYGFDDIRKDMDIISSDMADAEISSVEYDSEFENVYFILNTILNSISEDPAPYEDPTGTVFCGQDVSYYNIINGTNEGDNIIGTDEPDLIFAFDGNDIVKALGEDNCIYLGRGNDFGLIDTNNSIVFGGPGDDSIKVKGNSIAFGEGGNDMLFISNPNQDYLLDGGEGTDICTGSPVNNVENKLTCEG